MGTVSVRELRNKGGDVLDRVERGERLVVTRDGKPVAELSPVTRPPLPIDEVLARFRRLRPVDPAKLRADLDEIIDPSLW
jgi:prevent-host-death family protein